MSVNSYFNQAYQRFFFLHGHTDDEFCPPSLGILTLEEILYRHLRQLGYERIIFYNGRQKIYFHDSYSRQVSRPDVMAQAYVEDLSLRQSNPPLPSAPPSAVPSRLPVGGPLGGMSLLNEAHTHQLQRTEPHLALDILESSLQLGQMSDSEVVGFMARCVEDEHLKTAIIFTDGLDFITHFDTPAQRDMSAVLTRSGQLPSSNHNIYLFILPHTELQNIRRLLERHEWHFLLNQFFQQDYTPTHRVIFIGSPRQDEIAYLLHYWRLKQQSNIDWSFFKSSCEQLARRLGSEGQSLKSLSYQLQHYNSLDKKNLIALSGQTSTLSALERLQQMRGLNVVTEKIERLLARHQEEYANKPEKIKIDQTVSRLLPNQLSDQSRLNLHVVLKGNPGTGKTTVAQLIAEVYRDAGLLSLGHLIRVSREDLVAGYVGQTAIQTAQKISSALGGVLFVDEAYRLSEGNDRDFGQEAIETIMEAMSNHLGEFAVIIAGYPEEIERFLDSNPGLRRRFSSSNTLDIPDYDPETLQGIFLQTAEKEKRFISSELTERLPDFFYQWHLNRDVRTFGNAGEVLNLYQEMDEHRIVRVQKEALTTEARYQLTPADIPERLRDYLKPRPVIALEALLLELEQLVGLHQVKQKMRSLINGIKVQKLRDPHSSFTPGCYLFSGHYGTGKSRVAKLMGRIFYALGLLERGHLLEVERADLTGVMAHNLAVSMREVIHKSLNGILLIDSAQQLMQHAQDEIGRDLLKTLLQELDKHNGKISVILADTTTGIQKLLQLYPALTSRFNVTFLFENYQANELLAIFEQMVQAKKLQLDEDLKNSLLFLFEQWQLEENHLGNAHELRQLLEEMMNQQNDRLIAENITDPAGLAQLTQADLIGIELSGGKQSPSHI